MKYLSFFVSAMLALSTVYGGSDPEQKCRDHHKKKHHHHVDNEKPASGSFITANTESLGPTPLNIMFTIVLEEENIELEGDLSTFIIKETGYYEVNYGINTTSGEGIFSIHKNGNKIAGTEILLPSNNLPVSDSCILHFKAGDTVTLSLDSFGTMGAVTVGPIFSGHPNSNAAYISFEKIN